MNNLKPLARKDNLVIDRVADETVVYDSNTHKAHSLNRVADAVWRLCDGDSTIDQISATLREQLDPSANPAVVEAALGELRKAKLLEGVPRLPTRRQVSAAAAVLIPVVTSIMVPASAAAKSHKVHKEHPAKPPKSHGRN